MPSATGLMLRGLSVMTLSPDSRRKRAGRRQKLGLNCYEPHDCNCVSMQRCGYFGDIERQRHALNLQKTRKKWYIENMNTNDNKQTIGYRCKCGAVIASKGITEEEAIERRRAGCAICYLKNLLTKDIADIDSGVAV